MNLSTLKALIGCLNAAGSFKHELLFLCQLISAAIPENADSLDMCAIKTW